MAVLANGGLLLAVDELHPAGVQAAVAQVAAGPGRRSGHVPATEHGLADSVAGPVVPGGLDEQPAGVAVAGLGDRPLRPGGPGGVLAGHQSDERADGVPGEPVPVTDLDRQGEPGQGRRPR